MVTFSMELRKSLASTVVSVTESSVSLEYSVDTPAWKPKALNPADAPTLKCVCIAFVATWDHDEETVYPEVMVVPMVTSSVNVIPPPDGLKGNISQCPYGTIPHRRSVVSVGAAYSIRGEAHGGDIGAHTAFRTPDGATTVYWLGLQAHVRSEVWVGARYSTPDEHGGDRTWHCGYVSSFPLIFQPVLVDPMRYEFE
jgi:hypothetical protein